MAGACGASWTLPTSSTAVSSTEPDVAALVRGSAVVAAGTVALPAGGGDVAGWAGCAARCAIAGRASASAADATRSGLVRIAPLRHRDFDDMRRLLLRHSGEIE